jgi:hypothetical protein
VTSPVPPSVALPRIASTPLPAPARSHAAIGLAEQVALVDRARQALAAGDPQAAARRVDEYHARFPSGALAEEADVVRIDALTRYDRAAANRAGALFLAARPDSPHAARVRALTSQVSSP